jgi:hypothetical protein
MVRTTPRLRLDDPKRKLAANRAPVATTTVARPRESKRLDPRGTVSFGSFEPVICAPAVT